MKQKLTLSAKNKPTQNQGRVKKSIRNMLVALILNLVTICLGLIAQKIFLAVLGKEYLGLNSLFSNVLAMLAIAELGMSSAIIFSMYEPLAKKDEKQLRALIYFYKRAYRIIGLAVLVLGLLVLPFLGKMIGENSLTTNINFAYLIALLDVVVGYFLSYKRSILYASQSNYIIDGTHAVYMFLLTILQSVVLCLSKNYYFYLGVKFILDVLENLVLTKIANQKFAFLKNPEKVTLTKASEQDIIKKIRALFLHKVGSFVVLGTDNIIITVCLGLGVNGLYANYYLIIAALVGIINRLVGATGASVGNMLVTEKPEKHFTVFRRIRFLNFCLALVAAVGILLSVQNFIRLWIGENYLISNLTVAVLVLNAFMTMMRASFNAFKEAAGIFREDRFVPILESVTNIVASLILVHFFGLAGVFMGTIISGLCLWCFSYPKFIYKKLFGRSYTTYAKETFGYLVVAIFTAVLATLINVLAISFTHSTGNLLASLLINFAVAILTPILVVGGIFFKNDNFNYFVKLIQKIFRRN